jgi:hypothetical protein
MRREEKEGACGAKPNENESEDGAVPIYGNVVM